MVRCIRFCVCVCVCGCVCVRESVCLCGKESAVNLLNSSQISSVCMFVCVCVFVWCGMLWCATSGLACVCKRECVRVRECVCVCVTRNPPSICVIRLRFLVYACLCVCVYGMRDVMVHYIRSCVMRCDSLMCDMTHSCVTCATCLIHVATWAGCGTFWKKISHQNESKNES